MNSYYKGTLYPLQNKVLKTISLLKTPFYLTGGTALSRCYFNHRYSDDLDLFMNKNSEFVELCKKITRNLEDKYKLEVITRSESYVSLKVNKILKVDLVNDVKYRYGKLKKDSFFSKIDNIENILSNKISALISRDEPKDVVDIWIIAKNKKIDWKKIFISVDSKAVGIFPPEVCKRLTEFPTELLDRIKWVEKSPNKDLFKKDIENTCDLILQVK